MLPRRLFLCIGAIMWTMSWVDKQSPSTCYHNKGSWALKIMVLSHVYAPSSLRGPLYYNDAALSLSLASLASRCWAERCNEAQGQKNTSFAKGFSLLGFLLTFKNIVQKFFVWVTESIWASFFRTQCNVMSVILMDSAKKDKGLLLRMKTSLYVYSRPVVESKNSTSRKF